MHNTFIKEFMIYDQKIRFGDAIKKMLKPKHYFYLIAQILTFVLLIIPRLLIITNWPLYNIIGFILFLPTMSAFAFEAYLITFAFDYYFIFPRFTDSEKDVFREHYVTSDGHDDHEKVKTKTKLCLNKLGVSDEEIDRLTDLIIGKAIINE